MVNHTHARADKHNRHLVGNEEEEYDNGDDDEEEDDDEEDEAKEEEDEYRETLRVRVYWCRALA